MAFTAEINLETVPLFGEEAGSEGGVRTVTKKPHSTHFGLQILSCDAEYETMGK